MTKLVLSTSRGVRWFGAVLMSLALLLILAAAPAYAHESREVGPFEVVVGWWEEPAFAGQPNGPEITIERDGGRSRRMTWSSRSICRSAKRPLPTNWRRRSERTATTTPISSPRAPGWDRTSDKGEVDGSFPVGGTLFR